MMVYDVNIHHSSIMILIDGIRVMKLEKDNLLGQEGWAMPV